MRPLASLIAVILTLTAGGLARADDRADVVAANGRYERAFSTLDIQAIEETWAHDADVSVIHPSSKAVLVGWDAVRKSYADQPARHKDFSVVMQNPHVTVSGNVAWVSGVEKIHTQLRTGEIADLLVMATSIYEKRDGRWLMVHHHGSRVPP